MQAAADKMKNGGCPMCHRYFMIFYILRDAGLIDLVVTTFLPESPPKEVLEFSHGKRYPLVKVRNGTDSHGHDITGVECDNVVEIEALLERFDCDAMRSSKESQAETDAEKTFSDLYMVCSVKHTYTRHFAIVVVYIQFTPPDVTRPFCCIGSGGVNSALLHECIGLHK